MVDQGTLPTAFLDLLHNPCYCGKIRFGHQGNSVYAPIVFCWINELQYSHLATSQVWQVLASVSFLGKVGWGDMVRRRHLAVQSTPTLYWGIFFKGGNYKRQSNAAIPKLKWKLFCHKCKIVSCMAVFMFWEKTCEWFLSSLFLSTEERDAECILLHILKMHSTELCRTHARLPIAVPKPFEQQKEAPLTLLVRLEFAPPA